MGFGGMVPSEIEWGCSSGLLASFAGGNYEKGERSNGCMLNMTRIDPPEGSLLIVPSTLGCDGRGRLRLDG